MARATAVRDFLVKYGAGASQIDGSHARQGWIPSMPGRSRIIAAQTKRAG